MKAEIKNIINLISKSTQSYTFTTSHELSEVGVVFQNVENYD